MLVLANYLLQRYPYPQWPPVPLSLFWGVISESDMGSLGSSSVDIPSPIPDATGAISGPSTDSSLERSITGIGSLSGTISRNMRIMMMTYGAPRTKSGSLSRRQYQPNTIQAPDYKTTALLYNWSKQATDSWCTYQIINRSKLASMGFLVITRKIGEERRVIAYMTKKKKKRQLLKEALLLHCSLAIKSWEYGNPSSPVPPSCRRCFPYPMVHPLRGVSLLISSFLL
ncbi:hypothetical protein M9H77_31426 [Catharanthus roseus]|uniref:Uncharacterized protein n=1 Tax=Catharanthus roseus TaxID=4058 RepID=A0ACC0A245_CATRO|nr:hypothetical protein M9H77_31426 [Catharanthus roseus]